MEPALLQSSDPVSYTARIVAAKRAIEQLQSSPLFKDPYAAALAGDEVDALLSRWNKVAEAQAVPLEQVITKRTRYIAVRTKFMDDLLNSRLAKAEYKQVVILGAGLDTRAYRLAWAPGTTVYEVDCPEVLQYKAQVLQDITPACTYRPVSGDLATPDAKWAAAILDAGYQTTVPTIWLVEGVVMYLQEKEVHLLLQTLSQLSVPGSALGMDGVKVGSIVAGQRARKADRGRVVRHWQFGDDHPKRLLARYGWAAEVVEPQDVEAGYGRYPKSIPVSTETADQDDGRGVWLINAMKV
ncbi:SAM-dependent methyltransferase [Phormidium tenue FACHB-886]|nr:SAM-dependent methyltransferase [Phormidium tenue FACHB-886]